MPRKLLLVNLVLVTLGLAASCGAPKTSFYRLHYPVAERASSPASEATLGVERFRAANLLRQDRIVYSTADNQVNYYQYHRWAEDPATMVTNLVVRQLAGRHLFGDVAHYRPERETEYYLRGRVLALEEQDRGPSVSVRVLLEAELVKAKTGAVIWSGRAERERPVPRKDVSSVVEEMSRATEEVIGQLADGMAQAAPR